MRYLRRFPVDVLKLDRTFTAELVSVSGGDAIPAAVTQLARALQLELVAEGVETQEQRARLLELGFRSAQGYLFGQALPAPRLSSRLERASQHHPSRAGRKVGLMVVRDDVPGPAAQPARQVS